jgi:hypothetical protein
LFLDCLSVDMWSWLAWSWLWVDFISSWSTSSRIIKDYWDSGVGCWDSSEIVTT